MIDANVDGLEALLADDLTWTHSSGVTETKDEFLSSIGQRSVVYESLEIEDAQVRGDGDLYVHTGRLLGQATRDGAVKQLRARFLSVWQFVDGRPRLLAWQSTNTG